MRIGGAIAAGRRCSRPHEGDLRVEDPQAEEGNPSLSYSRSYLSGVEGLLKTIVIDLRGVTPPREVQRAHADLTRANELRARTVRRAITAIDRRDKRTARRIMSRRSLLHSETFRLLRRAQRVFKREGYDLGTGPRDPSSVLA